MYGLSWCYDETYIFSSDFKARCKRFCSIRSHLFDVKIYYTLDFVPSSWNPSKGQK